MIDTFNMPRSKTLDLEKILLLVWFTVNLGVGALTVHEYGMSIDEPNNYRYAADTLDAYPSFFGILYEQITTHLMMAMDLPL
jgi:hypothetical protein